MLSDKLNTHGRISFVAAITFVVLSTFAVVLRFWAKNIKKTKLGWDDFWISVSLIVLYAYTGVMLWGKHSCSLSFTGLNNKADRVD